MVNYIYDHMNPPLIRIILVYGHEHLIHSGPSLGDDWYVEP